MENQDYHATIMVSQAANEVFTAINSVPKWWTEKLEGSSGKLNDVFTVDFGDTNFVTHKLIEVIPGKKIVWLVTDCYLSWFTDKTEWKNTKMVFEIAATGNQTQIDFTHIGLLPDLECFDICRKGWDQYVKDSLFKLITEGKGQPQKKVQ